MKLSENQIGELFDFTKKKLVFFYDLQVELVDHLASHIEELMEKNKSLSFDKALQEVYAEFGIFGFSHIVREKELQLRKRHRKLLVHEIVSLFHWPNIIKMITLFALIFTLSYSVEILYLALAFGLIAVTGSIIELIKMIRENKLKKKLMLMQFRHPVQMAFAYLYIQFIIHFEIVSPFIFATASFIAVVLALSSVQLNKRIKQQAIELYPEAFA